MKIERIAIWVADIENIRKFYERYFGATANEKYSNNTKGFGSYFLGFESGARLEIMEIEGLNISNRDSTLNYSGLAHFAISVGAKDEVDALTALLKADGYIVLDGPRTTGDGYYESCVLDPEGNKIEITI